MDKETYYKELNALKENPLKDLWYRYLKECDAWLLRECRRMPPGEKVNVDDFLIEVLEGGVKRALHLTDEEVQEIKKNKNDIRIAVGQAVMAEMWV